MKKFLIVGGANGIGLSIATELAQRADTEKVYVVDKAPLLKENQLDNIESFQFDLTSSDFSIFDKFNDVDGLMITVGFGRLALFNDVEEGMISTYFSVNTISVIRVIKHFYDKLLSDKNFLCGVMVSIAGFMSSPFFSLYGATKAALKVFIESVNVELEKAGSSNRILNVSPGSIKGTSFNGQKTDLCMISSLAKDIIRHLEAKDDLFIPHYDDIFHEVLERYHEDFRREGRHSYDYKLMRLGGGGNNNRKIALVTGGTKGIGKGVALMLLKKGYYVIVTYANDEMGAKEFSTTASSFSGSFDVVKIDQSDRLQTYKLIESIRLSNIKLDCIICNAGITRRHAFTETTDQDWDDMMEVGLNSHYIIIRELFNRINPNSRIIFTASTLAIYPHATVLGYGVSKSAVMAMTKGLVKEFDGTGTTINAIAPGFVDTDWQKNKPQVIRDNICKKTAIHRFATVEEVVDAFRFCINNKYVNGSIIEVNGGYCYK